MNIKVICQICKREVKRFYAKQKQDKQGNFYFVCDKCERKSN